MGKQQLIMDKALELFAEQGINDTTVQQITDRCQMSKGAFYLAFKSKDELITSLIDRFMMEYTSDVDHMVRVGGKEDLLERFFIYSYQFTLRHQTFSYLYIKEQLHKLNDQLIEKMQHYNLLLNESLYRLMDRLYTEKENHEKYELVWIVKSFLNIYQKYSFEVETALEMEAFVASCVEKMNIIAKYSRVSFIDEKSILGLQWRTIGIEEDVLLQKFEDVMVEVEDPIVVESLHLLKGHIVEPDLPEAVVHGLLQNIHQDMACKEVRYLYELFLDERENKAAETKE